MDVGKLRHALEHARHALITKQGCFVTDIDPPCYDVSTTWVVDDSLVIALIDEALSQFDDHLVLEPLKKPWASVDIDCEDMN